MSAFTRENLSQLIAPQAGPCVTLCMPMHRKFPDAQQNAIRYANLVKAAASSLEKQHGKRDAKAAAMLDQLESLSAATAGDSTPWAHPQNGLAVFASPDYFGWFATSIPLRDITVVADSFHVKQLLPLLHDDVRYHVLAVTQNEVAVYLGNGDGIEDTPVPGVPRNLVQALGGEWDDSREGSNFHGTREGRSSGIGPVFHGHGGQGRAGEGDKVELQRFLRAVDRAVDEKVSKPTGLPLILAAVDYYHPIFRDVSRNAHLMKDGITQDPNGLSRDQLHQAAWKIFAPIKEQRLAAALEDFGSARARNLGSSDLAEVSRAAASGRVRRVILEEQRRIWGRLDRETGEVTLSGVPGQAGDADVLDDLAEVVLARGGDVLMAPQPRMPASTGLAALYRY